MTVEQLARRIVHPSCTPGELAKVAKWLEYWARLDEGPRPDPLPPKPQVVARPFLYKRVEEGARVGSGARVR